jgi:CRISPR-associated protein Cas5d
MERRQIVKGFCLEVSGPYACFTRPEMKVERVSYDVITPSAARAIFDAILWKPAIFWQVTRIDVLAPIRWISIRRNEIGKVASPRIDGIFIDDGNSRQQKAGLFLRDVKYRIYAEFVLLYLVSFAVAASNAFNVSHLGQSFLLFLGAIISVSLKCC